MAENGNGKVDLQELGLAVGLVFGRHLFAVQDLHYGYWTPDLEPHITNLARAQEQYSDLLIANLAHGARTILDVGCGIGRLAERLVERGYEVECVSPSPFLTQFARERLADRVVFHPCRFEELQTEKRFDVVLCSESFQYLQLEPALAKSLELLHPGGQLLIADFFKTGKPGRSPISGGHRLRDFYAAVSKLPMEVLCDLDITPQTAPTMQLVNDLFMNAGRPAWEMSMYALHNRHPWVSRVLWWTLGRKLAKLEQKHLRGERTPENFKHFKSYRLLAFRRA